VLINAWLFGWFLRLTARYGQHDAGAREEIRRLEAAGRGWGLHPGEGARVPA